MTENLSSVKEDMVAFVEGHGMRRFSGYVSDEVPSINWDSGDNPDSWKDSVELAKMAGKWKLQVSSWMAPGAPPMKSEATAEFTSIMGGRFLQQVLSATPS